VLISPAEPVLTVPELQKAGVKSISLGPVLFTHSMGALDEAARTLKAGDIASATTGIDLGRLNERLARTL
jgi:2-methylisocitrate lyase-like PEP mutase family enzyme